MPCRALITLTTVFVALAFHAADSFAYHYYYQQKPKTVVKRGDRITTYDLVLPAPLPPTDIYRPSGRRGPRHEDLATFAWLEFIALNAPANPAMRGSPGGSFARSGFTPDMTVVWETYQHRSELFPYNAGGAVEPQPWNDPPLYVFHVGNSEYITPMGQTRFNNLDETSQIGQNTIFFPDVLDDFDSQVLFQAKVNKVESDYVREVVANELHSLEVDPETNILYATNGGIDLPDNVIEVKSAWLSLDSIPLSQRHRYHIAEVTVYNGEDDAPVAATEMRALIGLHIIQKTPNFPAFIFATFEHTDILTDPDTEQPIDVVYVPTYDAIAYTKPKTSKLNATGQTVVNPRIDFDVNDPVAETSSYDVIPLPLGPVTGIDGAMDIGGGQVAIPVVQPPTTNKYVARANEDALKAMQNLRGFNENFVWQYYKLKGVQGVPTNDEKANDFYLANIVIESSQPGIQLFRGGVATSTDSGVTTLTNIRSQSNVIDEKQYNRAFSVGGCQGCHGVAQTQAGFDFSFLFGGMDGNGFSPDTTGVKPQEVMLQRLLRYSLLQLEP